MRKDIFEERYQLLRLRIDHEQRSEVGDATFDELIDALVAELCALHEDSEPVFASHVYTGEVLELILHNEVPHNIHHVWINRIKKMMHDKMEMVAA